MNNNAAKEYGLIITPPEEGALAAWNSLVPLIEKLGISYREAPMDLASRILTNGEAVDNAIKKVKEDRKAVYLKGPGITPSDKQMFAAISQLEKNNSLNFTLNDKNQEKELNDKVVELRKKHRPQISAENMEKFAVEVKSVLKKIGSPNARWRDALEVTLERGVSDALARRSTYKPAIWDKDTPFEILAMPTTEENTIDGKISGGSMKIIYTAPDGKIQEISEKLGERSSVRLFTASNKKISDFLDGSKDKISKAKQIIHGAKATVIAGYDVALNKMLSDKLHNLGASDKIAPYALEKDKAGNVIKSSETGSPQLATGFLIDNVHAILANKAPSEETVMVSLNQSYGESVKEFWHLVKENGGFNAPENSSIIRLSATKDHYKPFEFKGGKVQVLDGNGKEIFSRDLGDDNALITVLDRDRMKQSIKNVFEDAKLNGKKVIFGFDDNEYYKIARDDVKEIGENYSDVKAELLKSSEAAAKYFTAGLKDTLFVASNIMGDFYTDIELAGKGTSYSVGTLGDGRKAVELGTGGTAPDLLSKWKEEGILQFNPMAFVEGLSYGVKYSGEMIKRDGVDSSLAGLIAQALEKALYATTDNGIILPISKGAFTMKEGAKETKVGTHTFVKSVELEALKELKGKHPIATDEAIEKSESELTKMIAHDTAVFAILSSDKAAIWKETNKAYNEAREAAGKIDPFNPDYNLGISLEGDITIEKLLELQAEKTKTLKAA